MKMRKYIKGMIDSELVKNKLDLKRFFADRKAVLKVAVILIALPLFTFLFAGSDSNDIKIIDVGPAQFARLPFAVAASQKSVISIPVGTVKANPFVPYRDVIESANVKDVPSYNLVEPPEVINENSDAARLMDTIVSGILYDKFSPSAILNIEGNDYLVKKGDVINNYKVIAIAQDSVTVQLGSNTYKAGIGEILTEGEVKYNNVSNLKNKFGGTK